MKHSTNWKNHFKEGREIVLVTSSKTGAPNANIVVSLGFVDDKLLVANCQMNTTIKNLKENPRVCVIGGYFRAKGAVQIFSSGRYFDECVKKTKKYSVKSALLISTKEVFDLDKVKKLK